MFTLQFNAAPVREYKGKSLLEIIEDYVVLDLETTGLDPQYNTIIEIGLVRVRQGDVVDRFQSLVNPEFALDPFITELTGITDEMLIDAPRLHAVLPDALDFMGDDVVVAHNANFDVNFVYESCLYLKLPPFKNNFIDTMRLSRRLFPEYSHHRLSDLIQRFEIANSVEHRAMKDATQTYACYEYLKRHIIENNIDLGALIHRKALNQSAKDITTDKTDFDEDSPVFGKQFVFTGTLEKMVRKDAMQLVVDLGGSCGDSVTKKTNFLVLGNNDYRSCKNGKSSKQNKAERLRLSGSDIEILSENVFYDMVSQFDTMKKETGPNNSTNSNVSDVMLSEDEKEAFGYVCEALSEIDVFPQTIHPERRTENYLSIVSDKGHDFCRIKLSKSTKWISLSMLNADEEIKNDPFFANIANKNARHWKIPLNWVGDLADLFDIIQIAYISDHMENP